MVCVAWDVETAPVAVESMTRAQRIRYEKELGRQVARTPDMGEEAASGLVRATHPMLARIVCVSAVSGFLGGQTHAPCSWTAAAPEEEEDLLRGFWDAVAGFPRSRTLWVTFRGKAFDVPVLVARSAHYHIRPTRMDLLDRHPYRHRPHADVACLWPAACSLDGLCDLLRLPSPKSDMDGSQVAAAVEGGRIEDVARYCEQDVVATLACLRGVAYLLSP